jgi:phenylalanyl-tRNA synthetase beta chain
LLVIAAFAEMTVEKDFRYDGQPMKFSENWLRELVNPPADRDALCRRLTMAGLEVEAVELLGAGLDGVIVAQIVDCEKHPNADKLRVCRVAFGTGEPVQVVCGAPNARAGLKAPLAMLGAKLPNGVEIKKAALRGIESCGMLCSAKELGVDADASGLMELPSEAPVGKPLAEYLGLPDARIELKLTPNRPDCLGLRGLAYDVAALFSTRVNEPKADAVAATIATQREVRLEAGADCPRYLGRVIEGVNAAARSPLWLAERLRRSGVRPISAVVDVTQYVMLELGQPMHGYDLAQIKGAIRVRRAHQGETFKLLDGSQIKADPECLLIADDHGSLGLAGIMGGYGSRVTDTTKDVLLEAAHFAPAAIMGRARKFGMHTDASHRFERGVDPQLPRDAIERATALLIAIAGGKPGPVIEAALPEHLPQSASVKLRRERLDRVLGMRVPDAEVARILTALGMRVEVVADGWSVTAPSRRFDIAIEEDLIEEVVRVHGYERVPTRAPSGELRLSLPPEAEVAPTRLRAQMAARDYREAVCYSFVARELLEHWSLAESSVPLANPLSADLAVMRTCLLPGLVQAIRHNLHRQQERVRLFETGLVFAKAGEELQQVPRVAAAACGRAAAESWAADKRELDFFDIKADLESALSLAGDDTRIEFQPVSLPWLHPGRSAAIVLDGKVAGFVGALHPRLLKSLDLSHDVYVFEADLDRISLGSVPRATPLSQFPSARRDIAVVVPQQVSYAAIEGCVRAVLGPQLAQVVVFDEYRGENLGLGVKSLAIGLILQDDYRTLTDEDADQCVARAVAALERAHQARLRG